jgi:hypothetical protein
MYKCKNEARSYNHCCSGETVRITYSECVFVCICVCVCVCLTLYYIAPYYTGTRVWRSWLRHCATSRKVAGSIPDGVIGIFL